MSIEDIKKRARIGITEYMHPDDRAEIFRNDIKFLLAENQRLAEALERADKAFQRLSTGDFNAPMELSQIEAYQAYAASAHQWLQAYKLLERKEK